MFEMNSVDRNLSGETAKPLSDVEIGRFRKMGHELLLMKFELPKQTEASEDYTRAVLPYPEDFRIDN